jgi:hydrogenase maturation protein HypF
VQGARSTLIRRRLVCRGVVQGVGFRPAIWRFAASLGLAGSVRNDGEGATIEVQGPSGAVDAFARGFGAHLGPLARVAGVETLELPPEPHAAGFVVAATTAAHRGRALVPPDVALCAACRAELDDPHDRRHRHPFVTCTDCGPRFSLVHSLPYDRARTAMARFPLCAACAAEYDDPGSRRFHAEAIACTDCGPRPRLVGAGGDTAAHGAAALDAAQRLLAAGAIVAIKGLGGFQLACRADDAAAVAALRARKQRPSKPLALMARDLTAARELIALAPADEALLGGPRAPIVLAPRRAHAPVAAGVAPGSDDLGVMLPTTPLHVELFRGAPFACLVATSGNRSDEPICVHDDEARHRLAGIADAFLLHDRDVVRRVDDSVVRTSSTGTIVVRRSRGFVPAPLALPVPAGAPVLALGGHLQDTVCLAVGGEAFLSQHVGDLDSEGARAFQREVAVGLEQFLDVRAGVLACDTHPDYPSTWFAQELAEARGARRIQVSHHLAHAAAVLGEHGRWPTAGEPAAALVLDGTGHGPDGTSWGAELLSLADDLRWTRAACGEPLPLVGGEAAVRAPWRVAAAVLAEAGRADRLAALPFAAAVPHDQVAAVAALARVPGWPRAHGAGRLFEAAGTLLGACPNNRHEGEAAAVLEALAAGCREQLPEAWPEVASAAGVPLPHRALLLAAADRLCAGEDRARIARGLHRTYAVLWAEVVRRRLPRVRTLAIGGGCLVNRLLRHDLTAALGAVGVAALYPVELPPGDGGLAYGQVVVAAAALARGHLPCFVPDLPEV